MSKCTSVPHERKRFFLVLFVFDSEDAPATLYKLDADDSYEQWISHFQNLMPGFGSNLSKSVRALIGDREDKNFFIYMKKLAINGECVESPWEKPDDIIFNWMCGRKKIHYNLAEG